MESKRYNRQTILSEVGQSGQEKLKQAKVLIIGLGGLGAAILPYLAAAGIGEIGLLDDDVIDVSNLQRQVIYKTTAIGNQKVAEAAKMASELNPHLVINTIAERLSSKNAIALFNQYDIIVDGTDNLNTKYLINDACCAINKPFVYGSVYKFEGQVAVFNYKNGPSYRCVFPEDNATAASCNEAGVMGISVGIIGMFQANEVLKMVLGIGQTLSGKLLIYNMLTNEQQKFNVSKKEFLITDNEAFEKKYNSTASAFDTISATALEQYINDENSLLLDVRNPEEVPKLIANNCIAIPLSELPSKLDLLDATKTIVVFCQSGIRSKIAIEILVKADVKKLLNVAGGMNAINKIKNNEVLFTS
ncbi:HesA/MoeB/ThiF family protein [Flavobacterium frigidarium]|uniref:HesA/MoeB/ThiF family protein n=1 Tax=Flavobacterium frigidarium TaxID=99286 RepID=UPI0030DBF607|tara:strand:+ start:192 stop:1271 length:1080 start_codon:yes stop_codon:yes gene_type:complete